jgi:hypothetical protein
MKPIVFVLAVALCGSTVAPSVAQQSQARPEQPAHKVFVLAGCLSANPDASDTFKLTGAVPVGPPPPARPAPSAEPKDVYVLLPTKGLAEQGVARAEMQTHVGKKVEVTVRPVEVSPGPSKSSSSTPAPEKIEEPTPPRYTVTEIKSVAGSCPG